MKEKMEPGDGTQQKEFEIPKGLSLVKAKELWSVIAPNRMPDSYTSYTSLASFGLRYRETKTPRQKAFEVAVLDSILRPYRMGRKDIVFNCILYINPQLEQFSQRYVGTLDWVTTFGLTVDVPALQASDKRVKALQIVELIHGRFDEPKSDIVVLGEGPGQFTDHLDWELVCFDKENQTALWEPASKKRPIGDVAWRKNVFGSILDHLVTLTRKRGTEFRSKMDGEFLSWCVKHIENPMSHPPIGVLMSSGLK